MEKPGMEGKIQYFNSIEASKILGVNVSTIKRWTDSGKLECTKTVGGHRKFLLSHLARFIEENKNQTSKVNIFPVENEEDLKISYHILNGDFKFLNDYTRQQALTCNRNRIHQILKGLYLSQFPLHVIYDHLISPVLLDVGKLWEDDIISISEEHLATQSLKDGIIRLQGIIRLPEKKLGIAMCISLKNEMHDMGLKMVDHVLEARGFKVLNSGQNTPLTKIEQVFENFAPQRLYISSTYVKDQSMTQSEFDQVCAISERYSVNVYVGGRGFENIDYSHPVVKRRLHSFEEVYKY
jgi:excisionase family DNA binding protein